MAVELSLQRAGMAVLAAAERKAMAELETLQILRHLKAIMAAMEVPAHLDMVLAEAAVLLQLEQMGHQQTGVTEGTELRRLFPAAA